MFSDCSLIEVEKNLGNCHEKNLHLLYPTTLINEEVLNILSLFGELNNSLFRVRTLYTKQLLKT